MSRLTKLALDHIRSLPISHLQFSADIEAELYGLGIYIIDDLDDANIGSRNISFRLDDIIGERLLIASNAGFEGGTNWSKFWGALPDGPRHFAYTASPSVPCFECQMQKLTMLATQAGRIFNIPMREGYETLGALLAGLEKTSAFSMGFGAKKMYTLANTLDGLLSECGVKHPVVLEGIKPSEFELRKEEFSAKMELLNEQRSRVLHSIPLSALGLGTKTPYLTQMGWTSVGDIPENIDEAIGSIPSVGRKTVNRVRRTIANIIEASEDGDVDRRKFADLNEMIILPAANVQSTQRLSDWFKQTLIQIAELDNNPVVTMIVKERICATGSNTATLEGIAKRPSVGITRERVRQLERKFLRNVRHGLLDPWSVNMGCLFADEFSLPFSSLADQLKHLDTVDVFEFAPIIQRCWKCSRLEAFELLPIIVAIVEGTARADGDLRRIGDAPDELLGPLPLPAAEWPAWNLGAGKSLTRKFSKLGLVTAEDLRSAWLGGFDIGDRTDDIVQGLVQLSKLDPGQKPDVDALSDTLQRPLLPEKGNSIEGYLESVSEDLTSLISKGDFYARSQEIFQRRSSLPPEERVTQTALAAKFGVPPPVVSRTETVTLERLHNLIFGQEAGISRAVLRPDWLEMWLELQDSYERLQNDQRTFQRSVSHRFGISDDVVGLATHSIWAVLSGRASKTSHNKVQIANLAMANPIAPVVLSGFRRVH